MGNIHNRSYANDNLQRIPYNTQKVLEANKIIHNVLGPDTLKEYFPHIYVIALPERKTSVMSTLASVGIYPIPVNIVLKQDIPSRFILEEQGIVSPQFQAFNEGRVACHLSHLNALKMFLADPNASRVLVFEDDLLAPVDRLHLESVLRKNKHRIHKYDILYLGSIRRACEFDDDVDGISEVPQDDRFIILGRQAYSLNRHGARVVLNRTIPMVTAGDRMMSGLLTSGELLGAYFTRSVFLQDGATYGTTLSNSVETRGECRGSTYKDEDPTLSRYRDDTDVNALVDSTFKIGRIHNSVQLTVNERKQAFNAQKVLDANKILHDVLGPNTLKEYFPHIYIIALPERKTRVIETLANVGIHPIPVNIVLKNDLPPRSVLEEQGIVSPNFYTASSTGFNLGRVACHLSHLNALKMFLADPNASRVLVFEDDLLAPVDRLHLESVLRKNKHRIHKYDILYLGSIRRACEFDDDVDGISEVPQDDRFQILGRQAYSLNKHGARVVLERSFPMVMPGDRMMSDLLTSGELLGAYFTQSAFLQDGATYGTTLGNSVLNRGECQGSKYEDEDHTLLRYRDDTDVNALVESTFGIGRIHNGVQLTVDERKQTLQALTSPPTAIPPDTPIVVGLIILTLVCIALIVIIIAISAR